MAGKTIPFKYRAFISYSHRDTGWGTWLHRALEAYRIDKDLIGRQTPVGAVPATLRPIFRDRDDYSAGPSLNEQAMAALAASEFLIVICSPNSAKSHYVNEEIRRFKAMGRADHVLALIVDGKLGDPTRDYFAPALRYAVGADGEITSELAHPIAADARAEGDGKHLALQKLVAGLLGVGLDEIVHRAARARRRQMQVRSSIAMMIAVLALGTGIFYWQLYQKQQTLAEIEALVSQYSVISSAQAEIPGTTENLTSAIKAIVEGRAANPQYAKALALLKAGKPSEAEPLLRTAAEDTAARIKKDSKEAAEAFRTLGAIAGLADPKRALDAYLKAVALEPDNANSVLRVAWLQKDRGQLDDAEQNFRRVLSMAKSEDQAFVQYASRLGVGEIEAVRGNLGAAYADTNAASSILERLVKADPSNPTWQHDLAECHGQIGDILVMQGNLPEALKSYQNGLAIVERLAESNPASAGWQNSLSIAYIKIGDVALAQGNLTDAFRNYDTSRTIYERLTRIRPDNATWRSGLSTAYIKIGDVLTAQGNRPEALKFFSNGLAAAVQLTNTDPSNANFQHRIAVAYGKIGDVFVAQGNPDNALEAYRNCLAVLERLAKADPGNARWQRDLAVAHGNIGNLLIKQGKLPDALKSYHDRLDVITRLTRIEPTNLDWQHTLSVSYANIGDVLMAQGNLEDAVKSFRDGVAIFEQLAKADPGNAIWQRDLSMSYERMGDVLIKLRNPSDALKYYRDNLAIRERLIRATPGNTQWQIDLVGSNAKLAMIGDDPVRRWTFVVATLRKLKMENKLTYEQSSVWLPEAEKRLAELNR